MITRRATEPHVLPRLDHAREVVQGRIRVAAADRLDEGADHVIVLVALLVVAQQGSIDGGCHDLCRDD